MPRKTTCECGKPGSLYKIIRINLDEYRSEKIYIVAGTLRRFCQDCIEKHPPRLSGSKIATFYMSHDENEENLKKTTIQVIDEILQDLGVNL